MTQYETMVLLSPNLSDEAVDQSVANFEKQIIEGGGEVLSVDRWGKKRLAYPINRQRHGIYYIITYTAEYPTLQEIERALRLNEDAWRYMTVRMDPGLLRKLDKNQKRAAAQREEGRREGERGSGGN